MIRQVIRIVLANGSARFVIKGSAAHQNQVVFVKQPIDILKRVPLDVRVIQHHGTNRPMPQIR